MNKGVWVIRKMRERERERERMRGKLRCWAL